MRQILELFGNIAEENEQQVMNKTCTTHGYEQNIQAVWTNQVPLDQCAVCLEQASTGTTYTHQAMY